jgi:phage terminase large subunit-like protein
MTDATRAMIRTKADETAAAQGCYFDPVAAERPRKFFRAFLRHSKGQWAGQPFDLLDWQHDGVFAPLFGWKKPDGTRRFQVAFIEIPKKNGKSTLASGLGLYMLVGDGEGGAEIYSTAVSRDQAGIVHNEAMTMVESSPGLLAYLKLNRSTKQIAFPKTNSKYRALACEARSSEGLNGHALIMDELHAWTGNAGREFYQALQYAGRARRQPLTFAITTAGSDTNTVCYELYRYAKDILSGANADDTRFFPFICEASPDDDFDDPAVWKRANPSLGVTIREDNFAADLREAKKSPTAWSSFLRYSFNVWTTGSNPALRKEDWDACYRPFTLEELRGRECWAGLDLSRTRDMTALVLVFRGDEEGTYLVMPFFWLPAGTLRDPSTPAEFRRWAAEGHLIETGGDVTDYSAVEEKIVELDKVFDIRELAFDPHYAEELTQRVADRTSIDRVAFAQTILNFAGPTAEFERLVIGHTLRHNGHPVLAWQAGNVEFRLDANNNKRPVKPGGVKKIDGIVAGIQGLARAMAYDSASSFGFSA